MKVFNELLLWLPDHTDGMTKKAEVLSALSQRDEALVMYKKIISLQGETVSIRLGMGSIYYQQRMFREALVEFDRAFELFSSISTIKNKKDMKIDKKKDKKVKKDKNDQKGKKETVKNYDIEALLPRDKETKDTYSLILHRIGKCFKEFGEQDEALAVLSRALEVTPGSKEIMMDIAAVMMERGERS